MTIGIIIGVIYKGVLGKIFELSFPNKQASTMFCFQNSSCSSSLLLQARLSMVSSSRAEVLKHGDDLVPIPESRDKWILRKFLR